MRTEERQVIRKAMAFDLCNMIDEFPEDRALTKGKIKKIIRAYFTTADKK